MINDRWVSVPQGSEDFSFKNMRKNNYEESLFKCEDERYELEMTIYSFQSAMGALERTTKTLEGNQNVKLGIDYFQNYRFKGIAKIYGENEDQIMELLNKNPSKAIPVVLSRLRTKTEQMEAHRAEMGKGWNDICEKNFHKSLDHRSFYFKQNERKNTNTKGNQGLRGQPSWGRSSRGPWPSTGARGV